MIAWTKAAEEGTGWWANFKIPDNLAATGQDAAAYRAQIMELAYMAARLAEPSNRGLSDNDIQNALTRLAGDNNDPKAVLQRFGTIMSDGYRQVAEMRENFIERIRPGGTVYEDVAPDLRADVMREDINRYLGRASISAYEQDYQKTLDELNAYTDEKGNFFFRDLEIGTGTKTPEGEESNDEFLRRLGGQARQRNF
jgi:hypothetical protein